MKPGSCGSGSSSIRGPPVVKPYGYVSRHKLYTTSKADIVSGGFSSDYTTSLMLQQNGLIITYHRAEKWES